MEEHVNLVVLRHNFTMEVLVVISLKKDWNNAFSFLSVLYVVRCVDQSEVTNTQLTLAAKVVIGIIVGFALCLLSIGILMFISKNVNCPNFGKKE